MINPLDKLLSYSRRLLDGHDPNRRILAAWLIPLFILLILLTVWLSVQQNAIERLRGISDLNMTRLSNTLGVALGRYEYLPDLLARNQTIHEFLSDQSSLSSDQMGTYLRELSELSGSLNIYLMNNDGMTSASSNFDKSYRFVGKDFGFQPYFKQAIRSGSARYFALSSNSGTRAYYFSAAVKNENNRPIGVVVVSVVSLGQLEAEWEDDAAEFIITDRSGIIFMTSNPEWRMKTLLPLSEKERSDINTARRYEGEALPTLKNYATQELDQDFSIATLNKERYLLSRSYQPRYGWEVYLLADWKPITRSVSLALGLATLFLALTGLLLLLLWKNQQQRRRYEQQARTELETKVEERTHQLRHTQEELVQAAKMAALGQLSAAITHEINNPLSAIRAYADNAHQFLQRGQGEMAESNLKEITSLTERMAAITRQLKTFSRKSHGEIVRCDLNKALDSALLIMRPRLSQTQISLQQQRDPQAQWVRADQVWLEQILVNLLSNAVEAVDELSAGKIWLHSMLTPDKSNILIHVADNGSGISAEDMPHVFDAFFTTKSIGKGLGLGLSISYRLARDMQGDLMVGQATQGGAEFTLALCRDGRDTDTTTAHTQESV